MKKPMIDPTRISGGITEDTAARASNCDPIPRAPRRVRVHHAMAVLLLMMALASTFRGHTAAAAGPLVQSLTYLGEFSLPAGFEYGGRGLAFNAARNSLFASGFTRSPITAEVSIPGVGGKATLLQPLADPTEGRSGQVNPGDSNDKVAGGYLVSGNSLIVSVYAYYDGSGTATLSHFVRPLSLSTKGQVIGPVRVGSLGPGYYAGYMADVPAAWQGAFGGPALTGQAEISIVSRTSYGPAAFAFDPNNLNPSGAVPLVYYDTAHQNLGTWDHPAQGVSAANPYPYYGIADEITGLVFPEGTSSVLFFGRHGTTTCYGDGAPCGDPTDSSKGTHGYPYQPVMLVYDANDLAAVKSGTLKPWDVQPAARWVLPFTDSTSAYHLSGAAYDPLTARIYIGQFFTTGAASIIHVFQVDGASDTTAPALSGVASSNITSAGATISFTTNEPSYHQVEYGTTTSYGAATTRDATLMSSHSQPLTGLTAGTLYHYRARAIDAAGNEGVSGDFTFTTSPSGSAPTATLTASPASIASGASSTLSWNTTGADTVTINQAIGAVAASGTRSVSPTATTTYTLTAANATGSMTANTTVTVGISDTTPPAIGNVASSGLASSAATITFTTNEPSRHQVEYGPTSAYGTMTALDTTAKTSHSQSLTGLTPGTVYHYRARATDAAGNLGMSGDSTFTTPAGGNAAISIWSASAAPSTFATGDGRAVELGVRLRSDVAGTITGVRFYKGTTTKGTHTGTVWSGSGARLATATFTGESASGWQTVTFSSPVAIRANTVYVVSYHTSVGQYAYTYDTFAAAGVDNGPLHALQSAAGGGNGVFRYGGNAFPTARYASSNYWVDVVFAPDDALVP